MFKQSFFVLSVVVASYNSVYGSIVRDIDDDAQCTGLMIDFARMKKISNKDIASLGRGFSFRGTSEGTTYIFDQQLTVNQGGSDQCLLKRLRMNEKTHGVPIFGADLIVEVAGCNAPDALVFGDDDAGKISIEFSALNVHSIAGLSGNTFGNIQEPQGYEPSISKDDIIRLIASHYKIPLEKAGDPDLKIFPSVKGDYLSYFSQVLVERGTEEGAGDTQLYNVIVSAHSGDFLSVCRATSAHHERIKRRQEISPPSAEEQANRKLVSCRSCADHRTAATWTSTEGECPINALYLNSENRTTTCTQGTQNGETVWGPGAVKSLHWEGTYDCNSQEDNCVGVALPTTCSDALSDVQFGIVETMKFNQQRLGVMGGFHVNPNSAISTRAFVHYSSNYCNAFFTTQSNGLYFGDCDCSFWTPLTSLDVVSHEFTHGVTSYSSNLVYAFQPGGLNEAYSDIMGATMEFYVNDPTDIPDFTLGENLGGPILRFMEDPTRDTKSIDNACSYNNDLNVHHTSGVLNKAFVKTVRECQDNGCDDERGCVLYLGPLFMYGNIHKLTSLSGYLESATATCSVVREFYTSRNPSTTCSPEDTLKFIQGGFSKVGIQVNDDCAASTPNCQLPGTPTGTGILNCFSNLKTKFVAWLSRRRSGGAY